MKTAQEIFWNYINGGKDRIFLQDFYSPVNSNANTSALIIEGVSPASISNASESMG